MTPGENVVEALSAEEFFCVSVGNIGKTTIVARVAVDKAFNGPGPGSAGSWPGRRVPARVVVPASVLPASFSAAQPGLFVTQQSSCEAAVRLCLG